MEPARGGSPVRASVAAALLLIGVIGFGVWRVVSGSEELPYADGAAPPQSALVSADHDYSLAVPGGVRAMLAHGVPTAAAASNQVISLQCTRRTQNAQRQALSVSAESVSTKAENTVGHFVAPIDGRIHVDCAGWGSMFIPGSGDRPVDLAGWALLVAVLTLTVGGALALSELRLARHRGHALRASDGDDEVERFVDRAPGLGDDREVGARDRGDLAP